MTDVLGALTERRVIAILRARDAGRFAAAADVLLDAGVPVVEFTMTSRGAVAALRDYAARRAGDGGRARRAGGREEIVLGAGTVLTPEQARECVDAGATYLVTPAVCPDVIAEGRRLDVPVLPGALTPTEILAAARAGAAAVKVFPASLGGPSYIKAVRAPLPDIPLVPTGGVEIADVRAYLNAGALAVGLGASLVGDACDGGDLAALAGRARAAVAEAAASD